jgi:RNA polymerase sigma-70 factor (ECF subfamily)
MKAGDIGGLATLVEQYQVQAIRTAYLIVRERPLAEDITQAAFVRAYERINQFDIERPFGPWFLRSVANDAIKAVKRARRTVPLESESDEAASPATVRADPAPGPQALLETAEDAAAVWDALGRLPPEQRAVMVLRYFDGLSDAEIADQVDAPPATVRWRLFAARSKLRTWLGARAD